MAALQTVAAPIAPGAVRANGKQLEARYGVSAAFVTAHAREWGAAPMSHASNSKLRFHIATADAWWAERELGSGPRRRSVGGRRAAPKPRTVTPSGVPRLRVI